MSHELGHFVVRAAQSQAVGECNDDACGSSAQRLWVLDGATGVSEHHWTRLSSDASWLAHAVSTMLAESSWDGLPVAVILARVEARLQAAFVGEVAEACLQHPHPARAHEMPSACLGLVQLLDDGLELACVGDVTIAVQAPGQAVQVFTDAASEPFGRRTLQAWGRARAATDDAQALWEEARAVIRENRRAMNQPGGYRVVHPLPGWAGGVVVHRLPRVAGTRVLLASDGLWRLVELFRDLSAQALLQFVADHGMAAALARLRALEAGDPACHAFPRVKPGDDATGVLAELVAAVGAAP